MTDSTSTARVRGEFQDSGLSSGLQKVRDGLKQIEQSSGGMGTGARNAASGATELNAALTKTQEGLAGMARGFAASTVGFSLIAGGFVAAGATLARGLQAAYESAKELDQAVHNIKSIKPEIDTSTLYNQLNELQTKVPLTAKELADAYYNISSSINLSSTDTMRLLESTAQGAYASMTNVDSWAAAVVAAMNSYKLSVDQAEHVQDAFFVAIRNGVLSGEDLARNFGSVSQTAKMAGVSLDEAAAAMAAVTLEGGLADQNLNNLANLFQKWNTQAAQDQIHALGVQTQDATGKARSFTAVMTEVAKVLNTLPDATRTQIIQKMFPDLQAQKAFTTLISEIPALNNNLQQVQTEAGATKEAWKTMAESNSAEMDRWTKQVQAGAGAVGGWLESMLADMHRGLSKSGDEWNEFWYNITTRQTRSAAENAAIQQEIANSVDESARAARRSADIWMLSTQDQRDASAALQREVNSAMASVGSDMDAVATVTQNSTLRASMSQSDYEQMVSQVKAQISQHISDLEGALGHYATASENKYGQAGDAAERMMLRIINAINQSKAALASLDQDLALHSYDDVEDFRSRIAGERKYSMGTDASTPGDYGVNLEYLRKKYQQAGNPLREQYGLDPKGLGKGGSDADRAKRLQEQAAAAALSAQKEMDLAKARDAVSAATERLNQTQAVWDGLIKGQQNALKQVEADEKAALVEPTRALMEAQRQAAGEAKQYDNALHDLDNQIRDVNQSLKEMQKASAEALKPFEAEVTRAQYALDQLRRATAEQDEAFSRQAHDLSEQMYAVEQRERAALAPYQENLATATAALDALRERAAAISYEYEQKLIPLQRELNDLHQADALQQHIEQMHEQQVSIENLTARYAQATGAEREQIATEIAAAQNKMGREDREFTLEQRIAAIEKERDTRLQAVNAEIHAAELKQKAAQAELQAEQQFFDRQKQNIADQQSLLQHQREEFDYEQHQKELAAQKDLEQSEAKLAIMQKGTNAFLSAKQTELDGLQELRDKKQWEANESARINGEKVAGYEAFVQLVKQPFENQKTDIQGVIDKYQDAKTASVESAKTQVEQAQNVEGALNKAWQTADKLSGAQKNGAKLTDEQAKALSDAKKTIAELEPKLGDLGNAYAALNTNFSGTNTQLTTGVTNTFDKKVEGSIPYVINDKLNLLDTDTRTKLDFYRIETWGGSLELLRTSVASSFNKVTETGKTAAGNAGTAIANAFRSALAAGFTQGDMSLTVSFAASGAGVGSGTAASSGMGTGYAAPGYGPSRAGYAPTGGGVVTNHVTVQNYITASKGPLTMDEARESAQNISRALQERGIATGRL